ncbi:DUF1343 domain-containing protein [Sediminibacterium sp.]|uniref:exo-beta-N-acetylmuramidase NamZ family protein n=1 Tax=Sediminibacterium sp. TaxID=1917865 RepID=UPI0025F9DD9D|nr:DUF1343 domain-containing protein [Sediminibacterium sp.]MBT9483262.1 DUF1343 domain-containing protein [Sediminibacterium sp.]
MTVLFGVDVLLATEIIPWKSQRIGMVTNEAATTQSLVPSRLALQKAGFNIKKLFSPEHGISAKGADGAPMLNGFDELTDLPIVSLYGQKLAPTAEDLADIDLIVFDVPDIGVRFYTYLWTLSYLIESAATHKTPLIILDRPNPISGLMELNEGPLLDPHCTSFIGRWPMPIRHGCTLGELALYYNTERNINATLEIIPCQHWNRMMFQLDWGIPFVPTSPAIQRVESTLLYPGLCFLEATNLSEGRSSDFSFEAVGSPWLNATAVAQQINLFFGDELSSRPIHFIPNQNKFAGEQCNGVHFTVNDPLQFKPIFFGLFLIRIIKDLHPEKFEWAPYKTHVNPVGTQHLDKLLGIHSAEELFQLPMHAFLQKCTKETKVAEWEIQISNYLLY